MARTRKTARLGKSAAAGLTVALTALPTAADAGLSPQIPASKLPDSARLVVPKPVKFTAIIAIDGRSVTFKADTAELKVEKIGLRSMLHLKATSMAVAATLYVDLAPPGDTYFSGSYELGEAPARNTARLEMPRRSTIRADQLFTLTAGGFSINSYDTVGKTVSGTLAATGITQSGTTKVDISFGSFFDVPVR